MPETTAERRYRRAILVLIIGGTLIRLLIAVITPGSYDFDTFRELGRGFSRWGLDVYGEFNTTFPRYAWPPGYVPYLGLVAGTGDAFRVLGRLPPILSDAVLAWVVQTYLRARGRSAIEAFAAAGAIALSPIFVAAAGIEGQVDSVAVLPAVFAVLAWDAGIRNRALLCGLLIGTGAALKIFPIFFLLALLPTVRNNREALVVVIVAVSIPLLALLPFALSDPAGVASIAGYHGYPGSGGLSLLLQPNLAARPQPSLTSASQLLQDLSPFLTLIGLAVLALFLRRHRAPALTGAVAICLVIYILGANWFLQYAIWSLPFILMLGWVKAALIIQALLLPEAISYVVIAIGGSSLREEYQPTRQVLLVISTWLLVFVWVLTLSHLLKRCHRRGNRSLWAPAPGSRNTSR